VRDFVADGNQRVDGGDGLGEVDGSRARRECASHAGRGTDRLAHGRRRAARHRHAAWRARCRGSEMASRGRAAPDLATARHGLGPRLPRARARPHAARERLRVARALAELPAITEAFAAGELPFSAVRELTRVATADTDLEWRDAAAGKTVHEIEDAGAGHRPGGGLTQAPRPQGRR